LLRVRRFAYKRRGEFNELLVKFVLAIFFANRVLDLPQRGARRIQRGPAGSLLAEKGNYRYFLGKEIHEQPEVVGHTIAHYVGMAALKLKPFAGPDPKRLTRVLIVGCGTAYISVPLFRMTPFGIQGNLDGPIMLHRILRRRSNFGMPAPRDAHRLAATVVAAICDRPAPPVLAR
jgi:hypothetical protein